MVLFSGKVTDVFEMNVFSCKKFQKLFFKFWIFKHFWKKAEFSKNYQNSNSSKNFAVWAENRPKQLQQDFSTKFTFIKNFGLCALARLAHARSHFAMKTRKLSKFGVEDKIFYMRASKCALAKKFYHHILHKILHLSDTLSVFISL